MSIMRRCLRRRLGPSRSRKPALEPMRSHREALLDQPLLQRVGAEVLLDDERCRVRSGASRPSHASSSSWSASLPMRIGGFDQIVAKRMSAGTSSGCATTMFVIAVALGVARRRVRGHDG